MRIDNRLALAVSLAIVASLTSAISQVQAETNPATSTEMKASPTQMKKVNVNTSLTRTKLKTMSADSVLKLHKEGKIKLTTVELGELNGLMGKSVKVDPRIDPGKVAISTVMCPW
jgi:hypothetical protein